MRSSRFPRFLLIAWLAVLPRLAEAADPPPAPEPAGDTRVASQVIPTVKPFFPPDLSMMGINEGLVTAVVEVDREGVLRDCLVLETSHPRLVEPATAAIRQWRYVPARMDGEARGFIREIRFSFSVGSTIINMLPIAFAEERSPGLHGVRYAYSLAELDRLPRPRQVQEPYFPEDWRAQGIRGSVTVEFYIDREGRIRLPFVARTDRAELTASVLEALHQWEFEPPLRRGEPVVTRASQTFRFDPPEAPAP